MRMGWHFYVITAVNTAILLAFQGRIGANSAGYCRPNALFSDFNFINQKVVGASEDLAGIFDRQPRSYTDGANSVLVRRDYFDRVTADFEAG